MPTRLVRSLFVSPLLLSAALLLPSCSSPEEDLCDFKCDCEGCSDREYDDCLDDADSDLNKADREDCFDEYDDWLACRDDTAYCDGDEFETDCKREKDDFKDCIDGKPKGKD